MMKRGFAALHSNVDTMTSTIYII